MQIIKKKKFGFAVLLLLFNCYVVNETGLYQTNETGESAIKRIRENAVIADLLISGLIGNKPELSVFDLLTPNIIHIKKNEFYRTKDVNKCISSFFKYWFVHPFVNATILISKSCVLEPVPRIIDPLYFQKEIN